MTTTVVDLRNKYRPTSKEDIFAWFRDSRNVYCGRPNVYRKKIPNDNGSFKYKPVPPSEVDCKWRNPFKVGKDGNLDMVLIKYRDFINNNSELKKEIHLLQGKALGCWCVGEHACHAQILAELANSYKPDVEGVIINKYKNCVIEQKGPDEEKKRKSTKKRCPSTLRWSFQKSI